MDRCVIVTACLSDPEELGCLTGPNDCLLCADGGYEYVCAAGLHPHIVIGDFDSGAEPAGEAVLRVPAEKDETDTFLCLRWGMEQGFREFLILGGLSGRLDHTLANLQLLEWAGERGLHVSIADGRNTARLVRAGELLRLERRTGCKLSVFACSQEARGVCLRGVKYPLEQGVLTRQFPLGVSNEFTAPTAEITCGDGLLLVVTSAD